MNDLFCHTGRTLTVPELEEEAHAARRSMARDPQPAMKDVVEDNVEHHDAGL
jgi:hypothetical protein